MRKIIFLLFVAFLTPICSAATINVPSGSATIQAGINAASVGDTVLVADGTYTGTGNRDISFNGKNIIVMSENGPAFTILELQGSPSTPHRAFNFTNSETYLAELIGFTFKNGYGTFSHSHFEGGAMLIENSAPTIKNCVFANNDGDHQGGAVSCFSSQPTFINCTFFGNTAKYGGGLYINYGSVQLENCIIAFSSQGSAVFCSRGAVGLYCCDLYGNSGGDWSDCAQNQLAYNGNISENPLFCDTSAGNYNIQSLSPCSDYVNMECGLIGALSYCDEIEFPIAAQINYGPSSHGHYVYQPELDIYWTYIDTAATSQTQFEIEVGTDTDWGMAEMWNTSTIASTDTSIIYGGLPLTQDIIYHLRIRVHNGVQWGSWTEDWFLWSTSVVIRVPGAAPTIQAGIDLASTGDTILVAPGIYTGIGNRDISFSGKGVVVLSEDGAESTIINCEAIPSEPHRGFQFVTGEDSAAILEGFTIRDGYGQDVDGYYIGGAVYMDNSSPTINNCIFEQNSAESGGAIYCDNASPEFNYCIFSNNTATMQGGSIAGYDASSTINGCTFDNNSSLDGGALHFEGYIGKRASVISLSTCLLYKNNSQDNGGAIYIGDNAAAYLLNCTLSENSCPVGSGIFAKSGTFLNIENTIIVYGLFGEAIHCFETGTPSISCCNIWGNVGGDWVGCIAGLADMYGNFSSTPKFCNRYIGDYSLEEPNSTCLPENNSCVVLIGAFGAGCFGHTCGDSNGDTDVNVSDAVWIISYVFGGGDPPQPVKESGDVNCDTFVNVSDAVWIINYVFIGGNAPCDPSGDGIPDC
jgi:predicted outer membrane repeat protein